MGVRITIRNVDEDVRDEIALRAARQRMSMQDYLKGELERLARRPSMADWLESVRKRKRRSASKVSSEEILRHRNSGRE